MPLTFGGKRKPGGTGPRVPLTARESVFVDLLAAELRALVYDMDPNVYAEAILALDPDALSQALQDVAISQLQEQIAETLQKIFVRSANDTAKDILRNFPGLRPNPFASLDYGAGKVLPNGFIMPESLLPEPGLEFVITSPADRMFTTINSKAQWYASNRSAQLVTQINESNRLAIRKIISTAFTKPITVDETARRLRTVVGLHPRWADAVLRFDDDGMARLVRDGMSIEQARKKMDVLTKRYKDKLIRRRSEMIARTELQMAQNWSKQTGWESLSNVGVLDQTSMKEWRTAPLGSSYGPPCEECKSLRGTRVPWNGSFPNGLSTPPAHPHCRCTVVLIPPTRGLTGLPSQDIASWIERLDALEAGL